MEERTVHLKIKVKSLVDEARTIRREAAKVSGMARWRLNHHRTTVVRSHTRVNLLAYGILIGRSYRVMERKCHRAPDFGRVKKIAMNFGATEDVVSAWVNEAEAYLSEKKEAA